ncbi:MAG: NAD(P) transhydrogenase subunit alpha [Acidimicrobiales bacterium]
MPRENTSRERRVALTPAGVGTLVEASHQVTIEVGSGLRAGFSDGDYRGAGATIDQRAAVIGASGLVVQINGPTEDDLTAPEWSELGPDHILIAQHDPLWKPDRAAAVAGKGACSISLELIPRITRAQSMDVLSSMATVAGYEAALLAASRIPRILPMMMTAAGTVSPARFVILGAGVAGLQAVATARRLGAVVEGYDIRPAATEQIRSLGAKAIELDLRLPASNGSDIEPDAGTETAGGYAAEQTEATNRRQAELLTPFIAEADAVITTAAIPGAASPELLTTEMVESMRPGSVIIDLAAERGGNCRLTRPNDEVIHEGVVILGPTDLASRAAATSSQMFSNNILSLLKHLAPEGDIVLDFEDEITAATVVGHGGQVRHPRVREALSLEPLDGEPTTATEDDDAGRSGPADPAEREAS